MKGDDRSDVIVVGAGLSGLTAARELTKAGYEVTVLEARDRPGGRTQATEMDGVVLDLGGEWVDQAHTEMRNLVRELGMELIPAGGSKSGGRWNIRGEVTNHIPLDDADERIYHLMHEAMNDVAHEPDDASFLKNAPHHRDDDISVKSWLEREGISGEGLHVVETLLSSCGSTVPLRQMSFYAYAHKAATRGGPGKGNEFRVVGGAGSVAAKMSGELGERVRFSSVVAGVTQEDEGVSVRCVTPTGYTTHHSRKVILAVPPPVLRRMEFPGGIPLALRKMARRATYGVVRKMHFVFDRDVSKDIGEVSFAVSDGLLGYCGASQSSGGSSGIVSFCGGEPLLPELGHSEENRLKRGVSELRKLYDVPEPLAVVERVWAGDVYSGGSYMVLAPGDIATFGGMMGGSFGDVHLAGCEGCAISPSFMNSAVTAGRRSARKVAQSIEPS